MNASSTLLRFSSLSVPLRSLFRFEQSITLSAIVQHHPNIPHLSACIYGCLHHCAQPIGATRGFAHRMAANLPNNDIYQTTAKFICRSKLAGRS
jgi:hypothetical protein